MANKLSLMEVAWKRLEKWVSSRNKKNFKFFKGTTTILHIDGTLFHFKNSNLKIVSIHGTKFILVVTEHCGYYVFFQDDLSRYRRIKT